jgi:signal transduction histidine kinase/CheY-like chemotaxis protein
MHVFQPEKFLILIVDDLVQNLQVLGELLDKKGYETTFANNGIQALERLHKIKPDLILLDLMMPGMDGLQVCEAIKINTATRDIPIIFLTASQDKQDLLAAFSLGATDYIVKPFVQEEVLARIENHLRLQVAKQQLERQNNQLVHTNYQLETFSDRLKQLHRLNTTIYESVDAIFADYLETGCKMLGLSTGWVSCIEEIDYTIVAAYHSPQGYQPGDCGPLDRTYCATAIATQTTQVYPYQAEINSDKVKLFSVYLSTPIWANECIYGTLVFAETQLGEYQLERWKTEIVEMMAQSLGQYVAADRMEKQRKALEQQKDELLSIASHELRTPLTSIQGSIKLLASGKLGTLSPQVQQLLNIAANNTDRLIRLINDILNLERIESGKVKMNKQWWKAADLLADAIEMMQPVADQAAVRLDCQMEAESMVVWADRDRILQALTNLVNNAIKFSPTDACVTLRVALFKEDRVLFQVCDRGRGIPDRKLDVIFERFQQVDASDSQQKGGTGLGLTICREIIKQHNGKIWVESVLGKGSTFAFTIPCQYQAKTPD